MSSFARRALAAACAMPLLSVSSAALAAGVSVKFDLSSPDTAPFPSDRFTKPDWGNNTFKRVNLPKPDCAVQPSDCADIDVINQLDGFSTQPRITVPFTGDIDVSTVNSDTVYLLNLGNTLTGRGFGQRVGINQVLWDAASKTLVFESDELLAEHSRYVLVVTSGVKDAQGDPIERGRFGKVEDGKDDDDNKRGRDHSEDRDYRKALRDGMMSHRHGASRIVAASVFTTQSVTSDLAKIMRQIKRSNPPPVNFAIGSGGARVVFAKSSVQGIQFNRQTGIATFTPSFLPTPALDVVAGSIGTIAYGTYTSPDYTNASKFIPVTGTLWGRPAVQGTNTLTMQLFLPASAKPAGGYPVAIFGHGFGDSMYGAPWVVASVLASQGIATAAINVVGHGGGAQGTLNVLLNGAAPVVVPAGGRGIDQDGNGVIDSTEGVNAAAPATIISSRDGLRQTAIDLMQLVRQIEVGVDVDGDGGADLNAQRIYYAGQSFGGIYGTILLGVEPNIKAGVPNVPGGSITDVARLGFFRFLTAVALATRQPQLLNLPPTPGVPLPFNLNFNENIPLRDTPPVVNNVPGALPIQQLLERNEWVQQSGNPVSYAPLIRKHPLHGSAAKPVIFQVAKGDTVVPNPTSTAIIRAGGFEDRTTYFRNDLAFAANPAVPKGPHTFLTNISIPAAAPFAVAAQSQIAAFFASNGALVIDPDGAAPIFEVPIVLPLPETVNFIP
ncbi:MAG: Ig-like domain-containing protein [Burkholderiaceae bacterium]